MENVSQNRELFEKISLFLKKEGATKVAIFGSYARGEEKPESDIDVLVKFSETKGLLTMVRIEREIGISWSKSRSTYRRVDKPLPY
jgi:predicted nucleotidyltransferase